MPLLPHPPKALPARGGAVLSSPHEPGAYLPWQARGEIVYEGESMTLTERRHRLERKGLWHNEMVSALNQAESEIARLRCALQLIANHTAEPGTALEIVIRFAAATLEPVP